MREPTRPGRRAAVAPLLSRPRIEVLPLPGVADALAGLPSGTTVTVTCSPRRGLEPTVELACRIAERGLAAVPHLAARQVTGRARLAEYLERLTAAGVREVFVVGGDAPEPLGPYPDGLALLRATADLGMDVPEIGVPGYPEGHPHIAHAALWSALRDKQQMATYVVTQLCFDAAAVGRFVVDAREQGIVLPVLAGVPGVVGRARLLKTGLKVGVGPSLRFVRGHRGVARGLLRPGGYRPDVLVRGLADQVANGRCAFAGLHVYTFNHITPTLRWMQRTRDAAA